MAYDYSKISYLETTWLPPGYKGNVYNMSYKWKDIIPTTQDPIRVMEIGAYHGANVCCLTKSHAIHTGSEIHVVDPWTDYKGYDEYKDDVFDPEVKEGIHIFLHLYKSYFYPDMHTKNGQLFLRRLLHDV